MQVFLSSSSVDKEGYVQKEIRVAIDASDEKPENAIFLIPVKIQECNSPYSLRKYHCINLFEPSGFGSLLRAMSSRAAQIGKEFCPQLAQLEICKSRVKKYFSTIKADSTREPPASTVKISLSEDETSVILEIKKIVAIDFLYWDIYEDKYILDAIAVCEGALVQDRYWKWRSRGDWGNSSKLH